MTRVLTDGWSVSIAVEAMGIGRTTGYKWVRRYGAEGLGGLADRSSRPHRSPRRTSAAEVERILRARRELRWVPDRLGPLLGHPVSTVGAVLRRSRTPRLADLDRPTGLPVRRYEACHPGVLVHQDHKKLGRIPGGGHRLLGRADAPHSHRSGLGYDHFEVIVDDRSHRSAAYRAVLGHRRHSRTRPYRPQTNGKAERFIGTMVAEWAYARLYRSNEERLAALPAWVTFYNRRRPRTSLGGLSPAAVVTTSVEITTSRPAPDRPARPAPHGSEASARCR